jgi:hypothetical protein
MLQQMCEKVWTLPSLDGSSNGILNVPVVQFSRSIVYVKLSQLLGQFLRIERTNARYGLSWLMASGNCDAN